MRISKLIIWIIICLGSIGIISMLFYGKTTTNSSPSTAVSYSALICEKTTQDPSEVLTTSAPQSLTETISVVYRNDILDSLTFAYAGVYANASTASAAENELHSTYYRFIGPLDISISEYNNTYNVIDNTTTMTLKVPASNIKPDILPLFFLGDSTNISSMSREDFDAVYRTKGFTCKKEN